MSARSSAAKATFGVGAVFFTAISTILGAILFLRFGYAVGSVGLLGTLAIVALGHLVTIPTAMAIAEIATNRKVEGGGAYYILSRSFGANIGAAIGVALYLSQAISVAFYVIAFGEAFDPVFAWLAQHAGVILSDNRIVTVPVTVIMTLLIVSRGANFGLKALYVVVGTLFLALGFFLLGRSIGGGDASGYELLTRKVADPDPFFYVFAICFPAFTGMAAGLGLSGDLRDPKRAIPLGTISATVVGMVIYLVVAWKLAASADPDTLVADQLVMTRIALWGPIVPIGLACATLSSGLGSILVAPRTLQALAQDRVLPSGRFNAVFARGRGTSGEPVNAALLSGVLAVVFVMIGDVNFVAQIISMFFMVTYGSICLVSFLQHFAADPSYRPSFRSRWFVSLFGTVTCMWLAFQMSPFYAALAIALMLGLYMWISRANPERRGLSQMFRGAMFQLSRRLQVFIQKNRAVGERETWRPSAVCISRQSFDRLAAFDLLRWISHRYGFGTYLHHVEGFVSRATHGEARRTMKRLVHLANVSDSNVYVHALISPSYTTAICQVMQIPGVSGKENNMILFEYAKRDQAELAAIVDNYQLVSALEFDVCILATADRGFGYRREIHVWLRPEEYENAALMILLAYVLLGHRDWKGAKIRIFSVLPEKDLAEKSHELKTLIRSGRLPIAAKNIELIPEELGEARLEILNQRSQDADLVIVGFRGEALKHRKTELFQGYDGVGSVLFVNTRKEIDLVGELEGEPVGEAQGARPPGPGDTGHRESEDAAA